MYTRNEIMMLEKYNVNFKFNGFDYCNFGLIVFNCEFEWI